MDYDDSKRVEFVDPGDVGQLLKDIRGRIGQVTSMLNPATDSWPLAPGEVGVMLVPSDPPTTACILEHPDTGHWMLQYPCDGIFIADLTTGTPTF